MIRPCFKTLSVVSVLAAITAAAILAPRTASAREFYKVGFSVKLVYSKLGEKTEKIGSKSGELLISDDRKFSALRIGGTQYPVAITAFQVREEKDCTLAFDCLRPDFTMAIKGTTLVDVIKKLAKRDNAALSLLTRYQTTDAELSAQEMRIEVGYYGHDYDDDDDHTKKTYQFHDDQSAESLHLIFDFDNKMTGGIENRRGH